MNKILLLALAGAFGTLLRYWLSVAMHSLLGPGFPWGTWTVNILGCFLFGLIWIMIQERGILPAHLRIIVLVGFMGAFTTFSTYIFECSALVQDTQWLKLGLNLLGQNILGFFALYLGFILGRLF
ncbi:fluoride efflux transporter CrcB [Desulfonatronospira thiodismutans]|nr:fluoride efflux transporter CrcB [Desulfonatronospira thiodismutans]